MSKLGLGIMTVAASLSIAAFAQSGSGGVGEYCSTYFPGSEGACENCLNNGTGDKAVCLCKVMRDDDPEEFDYYFGNLGQCVSYFDQEFGN